MLLEFSVKNFLSFKELQTISFETHPCKKSIDYNTSSSLNSVFIYGPNSSGKSNLLKAMDFSHSLLCSRKAWSDSVTNDDRVVPDDKKLTYFEYVVRIGKNSYAYGIQLNISKRRNKLHSEWLYQLCNGKWEMLLEANHNSGAIGYKHSLSKVPRDFCESPVIESDCGKPLLLFNDEYSAYFGKKYGNVLLKIREWFANSFSFRTTAYDDFEIRVTDSYIDRLGKQLDDFDTGITKVVKIPFSNLSIPHNLVKCEKTSSGTNMDGNEFISYIKGNESKRYWLIYGALENGKRVYYELRFQHEGHVARIDEESLGTRELIRYLSMLDSAKMDDDLGKDHILVIDEIECSLHSLAVVKFLEIFRKINRGNIQLITTTHDSQLLESDYVDPFEIWFTALHHQGTAGTELLPLYAFGWPEENCRSMYLGGRFSSIPHFTTPRRDC